MKLRYKIISYSSQDPKFPISNLISNSGVWESGRFCGYPQQITLQFYEPITIKQFSIVSHQIKIASKISILFCLPDRQNSNQGYRFEKYGYISLSNNQQSNFKCRQCKKISAVNQNVLYMRLILWKNHQNPNNFFNQVGLSQINIIGSPYFSGSLPSIQNKSLLNRIPHIEYIDAKLQMLEQFKQQFSKEDDFQSAKQVKEIIKVIKLQGERIKQLQHSKRKVIAEENYDKAKKIKQEIDVIKSDIEFLSNNFYDPDKKLIRPVLKDSKLKTKIDELMGANSQHQSPVESRVKKQLSQLDEQREVESQNQDSQNQGNSQENQENIGESRVSYDNRVVPAILHKKKKDFKELLKSNENLEDAAYEDNQFIQKYTKNDQQQAPEEMNPADEANASIPIELFGKQIIKKLYSKHWNHKLEAITSINQEAKTLLSKDCDKNTYRAIIFIFNKCIKQGSYPILSVNIEMMNNLLVKSQSKSSHNLSDLRTQIHNQLEKSIHELFLKMGQNQKVKKNSESIIINMLRSEIYGTHFVYQTIHKSYNNPTLTHSPKIRKYKLGAIQTMLLECGIGGKNGLPMNSIDFVSRAAEDTNGDVRKQATQLLKLMKQKGGGEKVLEVVKNRQSIKGSIVKEIQK